MGEERRLASISMGARGAEGKSREGVPPHEFQISRFTRPNGILPFSCEHLLKRAAQRIDLPLSVALRNVLANTDKSFFLPLDE